MRASRCVLMCIPRPRVTILLGPYVCYKHKLETGSIKNGTIGRESENSASLCSRKMYMCVSTSSSPPYTHRLQQHQHIAPCKQHMARPAHVASRAWVLLSLVLTATAFHVPPATLPPMLRPAARSTCGRGLQQGLRPQQFAAGTRAPTPLAGRTSLSAAASEQTLKAREVNVCVVYLHVCTCARERRGRRK